MSVLKTLSLLFIWLPVCIGQCRGNKSTAEVNLKVSLRFCMAECLGLTNDYEGKECSFNPKNGKMKSCDVGLYHTKSKFKVICPLSHEYFFDRMIARNLKTNRFSSADVSTLLNERGKPLCDILIMHVAKLNKETGLLNMKPELWSSGSLTMRAAKRSGIKVTLRVGGWDDSDMHPKEFTRVAKDEHLTTKFVQSVIELVSKHEFDGITLSWAWPGCPQGNCIQDVDRMLVSKFVRTLALPVKESRKIFIYDMYGVYLNTIMAVGDYYSDIVDLVNYFYFEDHFQTGILSTTEFYFSLKKTKDLMNALTTKIKKSEEFKRKIIITVEPIAHNYKLSDPNVTTMGTLFVKNTQLNNVIGMSQWCRMIKDPAYKLVRNAETQNYAVRPNNLITYDDQESLTAKINFVKEFGAGVGLHSVKTDDVNGDCGCGRMPYLTHVVNILKMWCEPIPCF